MQAVGANVLMCFLSGFIFAV